MAMRVLSYDAAQYRKQLSDATLRRDDGLFTPVVTIVLYFGDKPWNYGTTLHDCLNIPDKLLPYVSDYRINVFDMHKMSKEDAYLVTGNIKHFPNKPFVVTPKEMIDILSAKEKKKPIKFAP